MSNRRSFLDDIDRGILNILQKDCRMPLLEIAEKLDVPKSTIHYRVRRLEEEGIIEGYHAKINAEKLGYDLLVVVNVRASFGPGYHDKVGEKLAKIPGVWAVYFIFGESDFIVILRGTDRKELFEKMKELYALEGIERVTTSVVTEKIKEDTRIMFENDV
ncbi:MAG: winged helix-turn-helix transcriptional regulator [Candidatus Lokiarchaeota archaeon]|nr:winged helix-turn-helix transcriptional regulator [Candidatus Lokiarchaeota archaeon]MBD3199476.1 winged helix-turn-helix transcriptional regulator [Candidatus Lokiarchaeota archaeon]